MSIASEITRINNNISSAYTACNNKGATMPVTQDSANLATTISSIPAGGGGGAVEEKDVNFYDYDGTLLHSYSKTDFLALSAMPENPTHTGLTAQGWNWTLSDAKTYVTDYGILDVGQVYTTVSGLSEFDIELTPTTGLTVNLYMSGTKNWGDGTSDALTTHTYSTAGKYTITCDGTSITSTSSNNLFGQGTSGDGNYYVKFVRIIGLNKIREMAFNRCHSLKYIIISNSTTEIEDQICGACYSLKTFIIPKNTSTTGNAVCSNCYSLTKFIFNNISSVGSGITTSNYSISKIIIPSNITDIGQMFRQTYSITKVTMPSATTNVSAYCFYQCYTCIIYDFSRVSSVPSLANTNAFNSINKSAKIIVPDSLYTTWIATSNWVTYADYIVKESDYSGS